MSLITSESLYFLTFHKTASSMVNKLLLPNVTNLTHIDYASQMYSGEDVLINFEQRGVVYGPIRLSLEKGPIYEGLNKPLIDSGRLSNNRIIGMVRDPRDILVSFYFSITRSHGFSAVSDIRKIQQANREYWLRQGLERYIGQQSPVLNTQFLFLWNLLNADEGKILLKYEDIVLDFDKFCSKLRSVFHIEQANLDIIYEATRPLPRVDINSHRRSGAVGGYRDILSESQVALLNSVLHESLEAFSYD